MHPILFIDIKTELSIKELYELQKLLDKEFKRVDFHVIRRNKDSKDFIRGPQALVVRHREKLTEEEKLPIAKVISDFINNKHEQATH